MHVAYFDGSIGLHARLHIVLLWFISGGKESTVQRQVDLPVWENSECDKTYFQPITDNFICAGLREGGKDACQVMEKRGTIVETIRYLP